MQMINMTNKKGRPNSVDLDDNVSFYDESKLQLNHASLCDDADQPSLSAIGQSHRLGGQTTARGNLLHHALHHGEALGSAEAPERCVGG